MSGVGVKKGLKGTWGEGMNEGVNWDEQWDNWGRSYL